MKKKYKYPLLLLILVIIVIVGLILFKLFFTNLLFRKNTIKINKMLNKKITVFWNNKMNSATIKNIMLITIISKNT